MARHSDYGIECPSCDNPHCEDNPDDAELAVIALRQKGIKTPYRIAKNADEALEIALGRRAAESESDAVNSGNTAVTTPSLVLLDLKLPGRSGIEVLKELRAAPTTRYVPIVVLTTSVLEEDMIQSYENGANSFIRKPVDFFTFLREIDLVCHYGWKQTCNPKKTLSEDIPMTILPENTDLNVLIIEDNKDDTELLVYQLKKAFKSLHYTHIQNLKEYLEALRQVAESESCTEPRDTTSFFPTGIPGTIV